MSQDKVRDRIYLSPPHMSGRERALVDDVFDSNWIAPLGPHVDAFEREFRERVGSSYALALNSGTAALHLALQLLGVGPGDTVIVPTLTFVASANPVCYLGARPVFVDSERRSWNMDPELLSEALERLERAGRRPRAIVVVHLYGQTADLDSILDLGARYDIPVIEDAAEALGATHGGRHPGSMGRAGVFSFNGNKIITASAGGMLVSEDEAFIEHARKLSTQARDPAAHYEHSELGYNYRLSNVLAAVGRAQLSALEERVAARRRIFEFYRRALGELPGLELMPEAPWGTHTRWLTTLTIRPDRFRASREAVRLALEAENIESRPVWKPMHLQPLFQGQEHFGGEVAEDLFEHGLCLPSGSALSDGDLNRIVEPILSLHKEGSTGGK